MISGNNPWELNLEITTTLDFSKEKAKAITISITGSELKAIAGINIIKPGSKVIRTFPVKKVN